MALATQRYRPPNEKTVRTLTTFTGGAASSFANSEIQDEQFKELTNFSFNAGAISKRPGTIIASDYASAVDAGLYEDSKVQGFIRAGNDFF